MFSFVTIFTIGREPTKVLNVEPVNQRFFYAHLGRDKYLFLKSIFINRVYLQINKR